MRKKLTDMCTIQYGYAFDSKEFTDNSNFPQLVRIRDVKRGYSETFFRGKYSLEYIIHTGDLLIGMDGEFNIARWRSGDALLNQRVCKVTVKEDVDEEYLRFSLSRALKQIENRTSFVTVKHLSTKELNSLELECPNIQKQKEISDRLVKIEEIISLRQQQLAKLDELVKARFAEMFASISNKVNMENVCKIITDGTHQPPKFTTEGIPFLFVSNIITNKICYDAEKFITEEVYKELVKRTPIEMGDVLLSTVGSYGHPAVVKSERPFCFQRHIAYLKPDRDRINSEYLHSAILSDEVQRQIDERVKGIAQKTLNLSEIRKLQFPLPSIEKQNQFAAFVGQTDKSKISIKKSIEQMEILKKALMQKYFG